MFRIIFSALLLLVCNNAFAQNSKPKPAFEVTGYPVPRFVSLSSSKVFLRSGPGKQYPVRYLYKRRGLPVEVVLEYGNWRKIKDSEDREGWVYQGLISGHRAAIFQKNEGSLYRKPKSNSAISAKIEAGAILDIDSCNGAWCKASAQGYEGWVLQKNLWGVYADEKID